MPRLPTKYDLGSPANLDPAKLANPDTGGAAVARGAESIGTAIGGIADDEAKREDALTLLGYQADVTPKREKLVDSFRERNDYQNFEPDFEAQNREISENALANVKNPALRERLALHETIDSRGALRRVLTHKSMLQKQDEYNQANDGMAEISPAVLSAKTPEDALAVITQLKARADVALQGGIVDYHQHHALIDKHIKGTEGVLGRLADDRSYGSPAQQEQNLIDLRNAASRSGVAQDGTSALDFIKSQEGFAPVAKKDFKQYSVGYGSKGAPGETLTREQAQQRLEQDVMPVSEWIGNNVTVPLNPKQATALTSFGYNLGTGKGGLEDLKDDINAGNWDKVAGRMQTFNRAGGKVNDGLIKRRKDEANLLLAGAKEGPPAVPDKGATPTDEGPELPSGKPSSWSDVYAHMDQRTLGHKITNASNAMHATLLQDGKDAVTYARNTGQLPVDDDGRNILQRAQRILKPNQITKIALPIQAALAQHEALNGTGENARPLTELNPDEARKRIYDDYSPDKQAKLGVPYAIADKNQKFLAKTYDKLQDGLVKDPFQYALGGKVGVEGVPKVDFDDSGRLAVSDGNGDIETRAHPLVAQALRLNQGRGPELNLQRSADGSISIAKDADPAARYRAVGNLIEANLAAQDKLGVPQADRRILSLNTAQKLLGSRNFAGMSDAEFSELVTAAHQKAEQAYGPRYATQALHDAVKLVTTRDRLRQAGADAAGALATGRLTLDQLLQGGAASAFGRSGEGYQGDNRPWFGKPDQPQFPTVGDEGERAIENYRHASADQPMVFDPWTGGPLESLRRATNPMGRSDGGAENQHTFGEQAVNGEAAMPGVSVANYPRPTEAHIEWLKKNNDSSARTTFDSKFGGGAARHWLGTMPTRPTTYKGGPK